MVDRDEMGQVFVNLINNAEDAVKAAGNGGTITRQTRTDPDRVRIAVIDTGTGMEPTQMQRIFLPFYTTEVQSVPGAGSSFTVCLPIPADTGDGMAATCRRTSRCCGIGRPVGCEMADAATPGEDTPWTRN